MDEIEKREQQFWTILQLFSRSPYATHSRTKLVQRFHLMRWITIFIGLFGEQTIIHNSWYPVGLNNFQLYLDNGAWNICTNQPQH